MQGGLSVERMCQLSQVSRASFYRYLRRGWQAEEEMALRSPSRASLYNIDGGTVTDGSPSNCGRKAWLQTTSGSRESCARINLLTVREQWLRPPEHSLRVARVHLNLAGRMTLSGPNQLWAADITYVRLTREFVYLAVVLDVFSRKVIGWALGKGLESAASAVRSRASHRQPETSTGSRTPFRSGSAVR